MKCGAPSPCKFIALNSRVAGTDHDIMSDENPGLRVHFYLDLQETFDDLFIGGHAAVSPVPLPLPNALLRLPICLGSLFFPFRTPLTDSLAINFVAAGGGGSVPHACRAVAGCGWVTADAREPCCGVAVVARGQNSDALTCAR